jgi:hypothetical protein
MPVFITQGSVQINVSIRRKSISSGDIRGNGARLLRLDSNNSQTGGGVNGVMDFGAG